MEDERPLQEAREALQQLDEAEVAQLAEPAGRKPLSRLFALGVLLVLVLLVAGLFLPPISLGSRLGVAAKEPTPQPEAAATAEPAPPGFALELQSGEPVTVRSFSAADFLSGAAGPEWQAAVDTLPADLALASPVYLLPSGGSSGPVGSATLDVPPEATPYETLDLYGWSGDAWRFVPNRLDVTGQKLTSASGPLPSLLALMQTQPPISTAVGLLAGAEGSLPLALLPLATDISVGGLSLGSNGQLLGAPASLPQGGYQQWVRATNREATLDEVAIVTMLNDDAYRQRQIAELASHAGESVAGIHLDYQGVAGTQRQDFTQFVTDLASTLHVQGKRLALTLATPQPQEDGGWDTQGQDWAALGQVADLLFLQMPLDPSAYADGGPADQLLSFAVRQIDRRKLLPLATADALEKAGDSFQQFPNSLALASFGQISLDGEAALAPGDSLSVGLTGNASPLEWDGVALAYKYDYDQDGTSHTVWLNNEAALSHRLRLGKRYNLHGLAISGLDGLEQAEGYAAAVQNYLGMGEAPAPQSAAIVWTVLNEAGEVVDSSNSDTLSHEWTAPDAPGQYSIEALFAQGDAQASLGSVQVTVVAPVVEEAESEPVEPVVAAPVMEEAPVAAPTGPGEGVVKSGANIRSGPGLVYPIIGGATAGTRLSLTGRNADATWLQVLLPDETEGWIFAALVDAGTFDLNSLAEVEAPPPPVASSGGGQSSGAPAPVTGAGAFGTLELGGQVNGSASRPDLMQQARMTWVKLQAHQGQDASGMIAQAHGQGFKILLSVVGDKARVMDEGYQQEYAAYVGQLAAQGADAIEIWNEANLDREWPRDQIDPGAYTRLLASSFNAIKSNNGATMVISGAPAPTGAEGAFPGQVMNDNNWLQGVVNAGGLSYMDCVGIHYNEGTVSPYAYSGSTQGDNYYTRYYGGMVNTYWSITGGARPLCFTELGYLSPEGYGALPGNFAWASNTTVAQQAQWLGEVVSIAGSSGQVRLIIVFNVDFTQWLPTDPQAGYAIIRPGGSCPACSTMGAALGG